MRRGNRHRSGRDESFDAAFRHLFKQAYRVARRILDDPGAAEDVAAETLSRAYSHWDRIDALPYRDAWVLRVATNLALNTTRRRRLLFGAPPAVQHDDTSATRLVLVAALRTLPARQREIIVLRHLAGFSELEVARQLDLSLGTVKTHLRRAKVALRGRLDVDALEEGTGGS